MSANDNIYAPRPQILYDLLLRTARPKTRKQFNANRVFRHPFTKSIVVLLGEHGCRHEHGDLLAIHHRLERRAYADLSFSESNVAANQPIHWLRPFHVRFGLADGAKLVRRLFVDERALELALPW